MRYDNVKPRVKMDRWCVHSYYSLVPYAPDNSGRLLLAGADLDKNTGEVYVAAADGRIIDSFGEQAISSSFFHTGFWQSWSPDAKYVYYQGGTYAKPSIIKRELSTGNEIRLRGAIEGAPPNGEPLISGLMGMLYAAGYGDGQYRPTLAPVPFQERDKHGLFQYDMISGTSKLVLSVNDILRRHPQHDVLMDSDKRTKERYGENDGLTLMCYCVRWSPDGNKLLFYFGNHTASKIRDEPPLSYVFTADRDLQEIKLAVDLSFGRAGVHWSWHPDNHRLLGYGPDPDNPARTCLATVKDDGTDYTKISDNSFWGHPSISPVDYNLLVTDKPYDGDGQVVLIDVSTGQEIEKYLLPRRNMDNPPPGRNRHWLCHHPVFSRDGSKILINVLPGRNAQLFEISLKG